MRSRVITQPSEGYLPVALSTVQVFSSIVCLCVTDRNLLTVKSRHGLLLEFLFSSPECEHDEFMHVSERKLGFWLRYMALGLFNIQLVIETVSGLDLL